MLANHHLLKPEVLAALASLELVARSVVDGVMTGLHRSPRFGFSQEFAQYRAYSQGDDPRYIDWNVFARSGRTFIKQFEGETNAHLMLLLDCSASMGYAGGAVSKFAYARMLAASLAYLASRQHDAVGLLTFADQVVQFRGPSVRQGALRSVWAMLENTSPAAGTDYSRPFARFGELVRRRGMVAVISDFYCDPQAMVSAVQPISLSGHDCLFFHLLDPTELNPNFRGPRLIEDAETGAALEVSEAYLRDTYPARISAHIEALREAVLGSGGHYILCPTGEPLGAAIRGYLLARQQRQ